MRHDAYHHGGNSCWWRSAAACSPFSGDVRGLGSSGVRRGDACFPLHTTRYLLRCSLSSFWDSSGIEIVAGLALGRGRGAGRLLAVRAWRRLVALGGLRAQAADPRVVGLGERAGSRALGALSSERRGAASGPSSSTAGSHLGDPIPAMGFQGGTR